MEEGKEGRTRRKRERKGAWEEEEQKEEEATWRSWADPALGPALPATSRLSDLAEPGGRQGTLCRGFAAAAPQVSAFSKLASGHTALLPGAGYQAGSPRHGRSPRHHPDLLREGRRNRSWGRGRCRYSAP